MKAGKFYISVTMIGFYIKLFTVDVNFEMGPRSIFFH